MCPTQIDFLPKMHKQFTAQLFFAHLICLSYKKNKSSTVTPSLVLFSLFPTQWPQFIRANPRFVLTTHHGTDLQLNVNLQELGVGNECTAGCSHTCILWHMCIKQHSKHGVRVCVVNVTSLLSILLKYPVRKISEMPHVHCCDCIQPLETSIQQLDLTQKVGIA
jgi:hypothetical protein